MEKVDFKKSNKSVKMLKEVESIYKKDPRNYKNAVLLFDTIRFAEKEGEEKLARKANSILRTQVALQARNKNIKISDRENFYMLNKKVLLFDSQVDFDAYMQCLEYNRDPEVRFYLPRRRFIRPLVQGLQDIEDDKLDLLTISVAPGIGKSTLGIFFLTWIMGKYPLSPSLASAHAGSLTRSFYDGVLSIIDDPVEYLWHEIFPQNTLDSTNAKEERIDLNRTDRFSTLTCRSIHGTLTGATRCEKVLYADDLVSGIEEALSPQRLDSLWNKYTNDLKTRKKKNCKEVHIATRWSVRDIIGRLEQQYEGNDRYRFLSIPALDNNLESNFDYDYGVGFDTKYFLDMKASLDEVSWLCLFMNQPVEREGLLYDLDEFRRYYSLEEDVDYTVIGVCDTAEGGGDYTFLPVAYLNGDDVYIEDCVCDNSLPEITDELSANILLKHSVKQCQFESNSAGGRTADKVKEKVEAKGGNTHITKKRTTANKETKIIVNSSYIKEHFIFKDSSQYTPNSPYGKMMSFLASYTMKGKNLHDDVPDGLSQLSEYIQSMKGKKAEIFERPF